MLLPLRFNDGRSIPAELLLQTKQELVAQFHGLTAYPGTAQGVWEHEGASYEDELARLVVDVEDTLESRQFFVDLKPVLLERFEQLEIYIVSYPIDVI